TLLQHLQAAHEALTGAPLVLDGKAAPRQPGIVQVVPDRQLVIRDLLMPGSTSSGAIDYVRETGFTNNAAVVAENPTVPYPQSDIKFDLQTLPVRTIAHYGLASKQILSDAPQLASYIDGRIRIGIALAEETQLLSGDGTGQNLTGLMTQAAAYALPAGVSVKNETMIDRLRLAMLQATLALFPATGHILNPTDWASIELTKDGQQRYVFANPTGVAGPV
ncbi:phage major capsid protein, partial [Acetobacter sp. DsW_063]|uniref:phage major capsid protein n=1 Tax=Acetobacter sp. DsW_063 TaxID=1514894 RepID=UPI001177532D